MSKRFECGLVVGKFSPLHRGHELVIRRALEECDEVVLISYSKPELPGCEPEKREHWLAALFPNAKRLVVTDERLKNWAKAKGGSMEVPANDAEEIIHRQFCGFLCQNILRLTVDAVFTSEDYGDGFAEELTRYFRRNEPNAIQVLHIMVDLQRSRIPISGTMLRNDIHKNRQWLSPNVYASFVKRICLLGGESSGKTALAQELAEHFDTSHVAEYGRELWELKKGALAFEDMRHIAEIQSAREDEMAQRAKEFLYCDTSPLTTLFYSNHLFGKADVALEQMANRAYDFTILCAPDFPFVQDGTRRDASFRALQHEWYLRELKDREVPYLIVTGSVSDRVAQIRKYLLG
jgi:NadR type nicotinamide-nucleotide adenylyltransferase